MHWDDFLYNNGYKSVNSWLHLEKLSVFMRDVYLHQPWGEPFTSRFKANIILTLKFLFGLSFSFFLIYSVIINFIVNII